MSGARCAVCEQVVAEHVECLAPDENGNPQPARCCADCYHYETGEPMESEQPEHLDRTQRALESIAHDLRFLCRFALFTLIGYAVGQVAAAWILFRALDL